MMMTHDSPAKAISITVGDTTRQLVYPFSPGMEGVIKSVFGGEYPYLPFLARMPQPVIVDIGANIGCTALLFGMYYPDATIYAVEPSNQALPYLETNVSRLGNVRVFRHGLYSHDASVPLYQGGESAASPTNSISSSVLNRGDFETIELVRASSFFTREGIDRIGLLKIDTEGAELPILRDLEPWLDRIDAVAFEYHSERDRLEIDHLLQEWFVLFSGRIEAPHRGTLVYAAKSALAGTDANLLEIPRPRI